MQHPQAPRWHHGQTVMAQWGHFVVRAVICREDVESFLRFDVERRGLSNGFGGNCGVGLLLAGPLLPFEDASPILCLFFIELVFPLYFRVPAILAEMMATLVTAGTVATLDVVIEMALSFPGDLVAVDYSLKIRALEAFRELSRLLMLGATGEVGIGFGLVLIVQLKGGFASFGFNFFTFLGLIPFLFRRSRLGGIQKVRDGRARRGNMVG
jgi:hypothetical protein